MMDFNTVRRLLRDSPIAFVSAEVPADLLTPVAVLACLDDASGSVSFLLESVAAGESVGRYSLIGIRPVEEIVAGEGGGWHRMGARRRRFPIDELIPLIRSRLPRGRVPEGIAPLVGLSGGWVGYFAYDCARLFERLPHRAPDQLGHPWVHLGLYDQIVAFDHVRQRAHAIVSIRPVDQTSAARREAYERAQRRLSRLVGRLEKPLGISRLQAPKPQIARSNMSPRAFAAAVRVIKQHIRRGDIFQAVLSQRWSVPRPAVAFDAYRRLRQISPSPYMYFLRFADLAIAGSSPETLVQKRGDIVTTRPIAGTRPRGATPAQDRERERQLRASPKENAEHLMLVDLGRNDLGRICRFGTVRTEPFRTIERFAHVMHLVSTVHGRARRDRDALDVLAAAFPAGTVTGAPKIRAMEIIDAVEPDRRGIYAGCVGYIDWAGHLDMAITIRTAIIDRASAYVQAGAGIVADSDPDREFEETRNKAAAPLAALGGVWDKRGSR